MSMLRLSKSLIHTVSSYLFYFTHPFILSHTFYNCVLIGWKPKTMVTKLSKIFFIPFRNFLIFRFCYKTVSPFHLFALLHSIDQVAIPKKDKFLSWDIRSMSIRSMSFKVCPFEVCPFEVCPFEVCPFDVCPFEVCPFEVCLFEVCPFEYLKYVHSKYVHSKYVHSK